MKCNRLAKCHAAITLQSVMSDTWVQ